MMEHERAMDAMSLWDQTGSGLDKIICMNI